MNLVEAVAGDKEKQLIAEHCEYLKGKYSIVRCAHDVCEGKGEQEDCKNLSLEINSRRADIVAGNKEGIKIVRKVIAEAESCESGNPDYEQLSDLCVGAEKEGIEFHLVIAKKDYEKFRYELKKILNDEQIYIY